MDLVHSGNWTGKKQLLYLSNCTIKYLKRKTAKIALSWIGIKNWPKHLSYVALIDFYKLA